ncbi:hypothetical protein AB6E23_04760, partial [Vibrio cyclitrophicus]
RVTLTFFPNGRVILTFFPNGRVTLTFFPNGRVILTFFPSESLDTLCAMCRGRPNQCYRDLQKERDKNLLAVILQHILRHFNFSGIANFAFERLGQVSHSCVDSEKALLSLGDQMT